MLASVKKRASAATGDDNLVNGGREVSSRIHTLGEIAYFTAFYAVHDYFASGDGLQ